MISRKDIIRFLRLYLIAISVTSVIVMLGSLILSILMNLTFMDASKYILSVTIIFLFGMGFASLLPLSEYSYAMPHGRGRAGPNPTILREGIKDISKGKKSKNLGILFFTVGLTLMIIYFLIF